MKVPNDTDLEWFFENKRLASSDDDEFSCAYVSPFVNGNRLKLEFHVVDAGVGVSIEAEAGQFLAMVLEGVSEIRIVEQRGRSFLSMNFDGDELHRHLQIAIRPIIKVEFHELIK